MDGAASDENFEALSIEDRLAHKSWKARLSAYTALTTSFKQTTSESDTFFKPYVGNGSGVAEWVKDGNAVSQEKGVEAACELVTWAGKSAGRTRADVVPALVEKCLGAARAGTRTKAIELCLLYVEVEEDQGEGVVEDVSPGLAAKQPKVVSGTVAVLKEVVRLYGPKTINVKPILKLIPRIFAHSDKTVRAEGTLLALALHSYLGPALDPHLAELKPIQVKELNDQFAAVDAAGEGFGSLKPSRFTRKQQRERAAAEAAAAAAPPVAAGDEDGEDGAVEAAAPVEDDPAMDPYEFADPVAVLDKLPEDFYTHLASTKWKDRKELALDPLYAVANTVRIKDNGNYDELTRVLGARVLSDANVACVTVAAQCIEVLAKGLRTAFAKYRSNVMSSLLERCKEKKTSVVDALAAALDAVFLAIPISEITEDFNTFAKHKNPSVKAETLKFLVRSLRVTKVPPAKGDIKPLTDTLLVSLEDSVEPVRVAAADALGTLMKVVGERALGGAPDGMDELRKTKVKEAFERAEVKCKNGAAAPAPAPVQRVPGGTSAAAPRPKPKVAVANKENAPLGSTSALSSPAPSSPVPGRAPPSATAAKGPPARLVTKKPPVASTSTAAPAVKKAAAAVPAAGGGGGGSSNEPLKYRFSPDDAEARAEAAFPPEVLAGLADSNWKARLGAIEGLYDWLDKGADIDAEIVFRYLGKKPGWKESNFQVSGKMFATFQLLADKSPTFSKAAAALAIPAMSDKLGDMKLKKPAGDALSVFAEKTSLDFVLQQAYDPMAKQKAPKAQADSIAWVEQSLREFGIKGISVRDLIEFLKNGLKSTNAAVRTNATKALVTVKLYVGPDIKVFIQDLNPQLLATIDSEFDKSTGTAPPEPTRTSADLAVAAASGPGKGGKGAAAAGNDDPLDDLIPRVDIEKLVTSATLAQCADANWKNRKEGMESIQATLEANKRLKPNLTDVGAAVKGRIGDSNKIVQGLALDIVARLATGIGKPFDRYSRTFAGPIATVLADQKVTVRAAGTAALSAMADAGGLDSMLSSFDKPLEGANPILRKELLAWLEVRLAADPSANASLDLAPLAGPILACLEDRMPDVRKSATAILPHVIARAGYNYVHDLTAKLKPASKNTVLPIVEAARAAANAGPAAAKAAPAASAPTTAAQSRPASTASTVSRPPSTASSATAPAPRAAGPSRPLGASSKPLKAPSARPGSAASSVDEPVAPRGQFGRASMAPRPRGAGPLISAPMSTSTSSSAAQAPPFRSADLQPKASRAAKETGALRWVVEGAARADQVEALYQQMTPQTSPELLEQLFSKGHSAERDYTQALTFLDDCCRDPTVAESCGISHDEMKGRFIANLDLVFKYVTLRIGGTNTTIAVKCLDLVDHLLELLAAEDYRASPYEGQALLTSLIAKVGDPKETLRTRIRQIFKAFTNVYPFSMLFQSILDHGLESRNARTRAECADELCSLLTRFSYTQLPTIKALPALGKLIADRDPAVRNAALSAVARVYATAGSDYTFKNIGQIADKERTMVEERLKRTDGPPRAAPPAVASASSAAAAERPSTPSGRSSAGGIPKPAGAVSGISRLPGIRRPASMAFADAPPPGSPSGLRKPSGSLSTQSPRASLIGSPMRQQAAARAEAPSRPPPASEPLELRNGHASTFEGIVTEDVGRSVDALKVVQNDISIDPASLVPYADALMVAITKEMKVGFEGLGADTPQTVLRLCKHLMSTLSAFFDQKSLGQAVSANALTGLVSELTHRLQATAENPANESISSLSKVLNMVLIRIFHHADQNACFTALFTVLREATVNLPTYQGDELAERSKYAELVMKCVWKVSKTVKDSLESTSLQPASLLREIDLFLVAIPPAEWRRRSTEKVPLTDMPLRTVKTILQQVVSVYGEKILPELDSVDPSRASFVCQYITRLVRDASAAKSLPMDARTSSSGSHLAPDTIASAALRSPVPSNSSPAPSPAIMSSPDPEIETNQRLKVIFDRIGDPAESRNGIADLYAFQKLHPEAEAKVAAWMSTTGAYFQSYMRRALDNLAQQDPNRVATPPIVNGRRDSRIAPASPRVSQSLNGSGSVPGSPATGAKLDDLKAIFGYKEATE